MSPLTFTFTTRPGLNEFIGEWSAKHDVKPHLETWGTLWDTIRDAAFARYGIEVAEVGTTWMPTLVGMNALRQFQPREVEYIGGEKSFSPPVWKSTHLEDDQRIWSIPWTVDARVIYYWADMLDAVGLDATTAFASPEQMPLSLERLRSQAETPWGITTHCETMTVQNVASWIWCGGGDFVATDGSKTRFTEPQALHSIEQFYSLYDYMPHRSTPIDSDILADLFVERRIAAVMSGPWFTERLHTRLGHSDAFKNIRTTLPPGPPFVGGTNLVVLANTSPSSERSAIELIRWLVSKDVQQRCYEDFGLLPVRSDIFSVALASTDPITIGYMDAVRFGRSYTSILRWGLVEDRLVDVLGAIWADVQTTDKPVKDIIHERLQSAAHSLDRVLAQ